MTRVVRPPPSAITTPVKPSSPRSTSVSRKGEAWVGMPSIVDWQASVISAPAAPKPACHGGKWVWRRARSPISTELPSRPPTLGVCAGKAEGRARPVGGRRVGALHSVHDGRDEARHMEGVLAEELADPAEPWVPGQFGGQRVQHVHADTASLGGDAGVDVPDETGVPGGADARAFREDRRAGGAEPVGALADLEEGDAVGVRAAMSWRWLASRACWRGVRGWSTGIIPLTVSFMSPKKPPPGPSSGCQVPATNRSRSGRRWSRGCRRYESCGQDLREVQLRDLLGEGHAGEQGFDPGSQEVASSSGGAAPRGAVSRGVASRVPRRQWSVRRRWRRRPLPGPPSRAGRAGSGHPGWG